jgi:hypothetical protein
MGRRSYNTKVVHPEIHKRVYEIVRLRKLASRRRDTVPYRVANCTAEQVALFTSLGLGAAHAALVALQQAAQVATDAYMPTYRKVEEAERKLWQGRMTQAYDRQVLTELLSPELTQASAAMFDGFHDCNVRNIVQRSDHDLAAIEAAALAGADALTKAIKDRILPKALEAACRRNATRAELADLMAQRDAAQQSMNEADTAFDSARRLFIEALGKDEDAEEVRLLAELKRLYCTNKTEAVKLVGLAEDNRLYQAATT